MTRPSGPPGPPATALGSYRALRVLGRGALGTTYEAEPRDHGPYVVVKQLRIARVDDRDAVEALEAEARVLAQLTHPAIPRYLDWFSAEQGGETAFHVVQHAAPGQPLGALVAGGWRADEAEARRIAAALLDVLDYLHARVPPVYHRDIKPQNVVREDGGKVWLVDFGSIGDVYRGTAAGGAGASGPSSLPPKSFRGGARPESDLYGVGATLVFALGGGPDGQLGPEARAAVSPVFARWLDTMVDPVPDRRFASARQALVVLTAEERPAQRHGRTALLAAALVALVAAVFVYVPAARTGAKRLAAVVASVRPVARAAPAGSAR